MRTSMMEYRTHFHGYEFGKGIAPYNNPVNLHAGWEQIFDPENISAAPHSLRHHINSMVSGLSSLRGDKLYGLGYAQDYLYPFLNENGFARIPHSQKVAELAVRWNDVFESKMAKMKKLETNPRPNDLSLLRGLGMQPVIDEIAEAKRLDLEGKMPQNGTRPSLYKNIDLVAMRFHPHLFRQLLTFADTIAQEASFSPERGIIMHNIYNFA